MFQDASDLAAMAEALVQLRLQTGEAPTFVPKVPRDVRPPSQRPFPLLRPNCRARRARSLMDHYDTSLAERLGAYVN